MCIYSVFCINDWFLVSNNKIPLNLLIFILSMVIKLKTIYILSFYLLLYVII